MLQIRNLSKSYGSDTILADCSLLINDGEHVGLIGPNGVGKSTLLRCLIGAEAPDRGVIVRSPTDLSIGYLAQALDMAEDQTVAAFMESAQADLIAAERELAAAAEALSSADLDRAMARYDAALAQFETLGGYEREHRAGVILDGLGLREIPGDRRVAALSGGQKTRLGLAALLLSEPGLLLLDEPTNHLDTEALEWLEGFVKDYPHMALIVSHDRAFLDATVSRILYLSPESRAIRSYPGNYSDFAAAREQERQIHAETWKKQQEYVSKVESDIARLKGQALGVELSTTPSQPQVRRLAKKVAKKAKSRERKLERYLESDERVEKPRQRWGLKLDFGPAPEGGQAVLRIEDLTFAYPSAPGAEPLLRDVSLEVFAGERVALVGPNGAGKTTLLRLIEGRLAPLSGRVRVGAGVRLGVLAQEHETLDVQRTVLEMVMRTRPMGETEARNFLHFFLFSGDSVFQRVGTCSLGERSRLQLALLVLSGCNLLLLDEPLNHLDIEGREHFEEALDAFDGTVITVSHDRAFLDSFAERVVEVRDGRVREIYD
jgi:ATP-binding cassette, subfamily F, member 3